MEALQIEAIGINKYGDVPAAFGLLWKGKVKHRWVHLNDNLYAHFLGERNG